MIFIRRCSLITFTPGSCSVQPAAAVGVKRLAQGHLSGGNKGGASSVSSLSATHIYPAHLGIEPATFWSQARFSQGNVFWRCLKNIHSFLFSFFFKYIVLYCINCTIYCFNCTVIIIVIIIIFIIFCTF